VLSTHPLQPGVTHWLLVHWAAPVQLRHASPPVPHAALVVPVWQVPVLSMQPLQEASTHAPAVHCWVD
jgi:hypothetical protein